MVRARPRRAPTVPDDLVRTVSSWAGERGRAWLAALPAEIEALADEWGLDVGEPYQPSGYTSWAAPVTRDGEPLVLKVRVPDEDSSWENAALRHYGGGACVRLVAEKQHALLLERCEPGTLLAAEPDDTVATVVAETLLELWEAPVPDDLPHVRDLWSRWRGVVERSEVPRRDEALATLDDLLADGPRDVLLHGDLHGGNVLRATRRPWLAIDPKGRVGDPARDAVPVVRDRAAPGLVRRRLDIVSEVLGIDRERIRAWTLVQVVEGLAWCREAGDEPGAADFANALSLLEE